MKVSTKTLELIKQDLLDIQNKIINNEGALDEMLDLELAQIEANLSVKADHYAFRLDRLDNKLNFWEQKKEEAFEAVKSIRNHIDNMKTRIKDTMKVLDKKEIKGDEYIFRTKMGNPKLILETELLPKEYYIVETITKPDTERIKEDLKSGKVIDGAKLIYNHSLSVITNKG